MNINPIPRCALKLTYTSHNVRTPSYPRYPVFQQATRPVTAPGTIRYGLFVGYKANDPAKLIIGEIDMPNFISIVCWPDKFPNFVSENTLTPT